MHESKIDTKRFGFKVGKTDGKLFKKSSLEEIKNNNYKFVIARVDYNDVELMNKMEDIGFRIKEVQITYKHNFSTLDTDHTFYTDPNILIREFRYSDTPILVDMAKVAFNNYGHYFNNKGLDRKKCLEVYEDWAFNSCTKREFADKIIVACKNNIPVGYLSFKIYNKGIGKRYAAGGMGAVDGNERGRGVFLKILRAGLDWSFKANLDWCEHNVIVSNFPVNRSMSKAGFRPEKPVATMHWMSN